MADGAWLSPALLRAVAWMDLALGGAVGYQAWRLVGRGDTANAAWLAVAALWLLYLAVATWRRLARRGQGGQG